MRPTHLCSGLILAAAGAVLAGSPAVAQTYSPWSFGATIGQDVAVGGDVIGPANSASLNLNTLNANLTGTGRLAMRGTSWDEAYDSGLTVSVEVRYASTDFSEFFGAVTYTQADAADNVVVGCLVTTVPNCGTTLTGSFSDFRQIGLEGGYRQWFGFSVLGDTIKPYFAVRGGLVHTDEIRFRVNAGAAGGLGDWNLYEEGWTAMIGADLGATYAISQNAEIGGEIGVRYTTSLSDDDSDFGALGLATINDESERLSVPVSVRLNAVF